MVKTASGQFEGIAAKLKVLSIKFDVPDVVAVNSDFDERKIGPDGKAQPDNEDVDLRNEEGSPQFINLKSCVLDVTPQDDSLLTGATIKINRKDVQDEEGEVRLLGVRLNEFETVEIPLDEDLAENFFRSTGRHSGFDACWVEGMKPGPITLELEYKQGGWR